MDVFYHVNYLHFELLTGHEYLQPEFEYHAVESNIFIFLIQFQFFSTSALWTNKSSNQNRCVERSSHLPSNNNIHSRVLVINWTSCCSVVSDEALNYLSIILKCISNRLCLNYSITVSVPRTFAVSCQNISVNQFSWVPVANSFEFWSEHFASKHFTFSRCLFTTRPLSQSRPPSTHVKGCPVTLCICHATCKCNKNVFSASFKYT